MGHLCCSHKTGKLSVSHSFLTAVNIIFQVKAYGPGLQSSGLAVGKPTEFTVDAKQGGKAPLKILAQVSHRVELGPFSIFGASKQSPYCYSSFAQDGEGMPVDVQIKDNGNGTYTCTYTPRKPVKHTVMVSWGGVNIPESPFRVSTAAHTCKCFLHTMSLIQKCLVSDHR